MANWEIKNSDGETIGSIEKEKQDYSHEGPEDRGEGFWLLLIGNPLMAALGGLVLGIAAAALTVPGRITVAAVQKVFGGSPEGRAAIHQTEPLAVAVAIGKWGFFLLLFVLTAKWFTKIENLKGCGLVIIGVIVVFVVIYAFLAISQYAST